jgi:hypothetical protein
MMERSYEDAVQALRNRLGGRWEGLETDGRDEMVRVLRRELDFDERQSNDAIDAMIASGQIRYQRLREGRHEVVPPPLTPPGEGMATGVPAAGGLGGMPLAPGEVAAAGYWQIGRDDDAPTGRAGQVQIDY